MNGSANAPIQHSPGDGPGNGLIPSAERFTVEIITGGVVSEYTADLTRVACGAEFTNGTDLAARMRVLESLRDWLEIHGALTPGSGVLVRTLPEKAHPEDIAEEQAMPGTVLDRREIVTLVREAHTGAKSG